MTIEKLEEYLSEEELEFFQSLAPSYQKIFVNHAFSPKREETRLKNLDEVKEAMELKCKNIFDYRKKKNPSAIKKDDLSVEENIKLFFEKISDDQQREKISNLYYHLVDLDDDLTSIYAWNQPMIKYKETFILAFSVAKAHFAIGLDARTLDFFTSNIQDNQYELMKKGFKVKYTQGINLQLFEEMVKYTIIIKKDATGFWD